MSDVFTPYEIGLDELLKLLDSEHASYAALLVFQQQLIENIRQARQDGDTGTRRADRARIIRGLNSLAKSALGISFNDLCPLQMDVDRHQVGPGSLPILDRTINDTLRNVIETENLVPVYQISGSGQFILIGLVKR